MTWQELQKGWKFFTYRELTVSPTAAKLGIDNTPSPDHLRNLDRLVREALDPFRGAVGGPVRVTSGYRSRALNQALPRSSKTSAHMLGLAADVKVDGKTATDLARVFLQAGIPFDQLIGYAPSEGGHLHIGLSSAPRRQLLWIGPNGAERWNP